MGCMTPDRALELSEALWHQRRRAMRNRPVEYNEAEEVLIELSKLRGRGDHED